MSKEEIEMRSEYYLVIERKNAQRMVLQFHTTERNVNKVFYALAIAAGGSDMKSCSLFLRHNDPRNVSIVIKDKRINYFEVKNG